MTALVRRPQKPWFASPTALLAALVLSLFAYPGCKQETEPVFELKAPGVDVEVQKSDKGVDVKVREKKTSE
jgi:hypothetical protein